jgi:peptide/nickel transport system permease protein
MTEYLIRRAVQSVLVLFLVSVISFALMHAAPGGPLMVMLPKGGSQQAILAQEKNAGLLDPMPIQYLHWLGQLLHGNLGYTYKNHVPVGQILLPTVGNTLILMGVAWVLSLLIAIPWGIYNSTRTYGISDNISTVLAYLGFAMPAFWFGILLQEFLSLDLNWFPLSDMYSMNKQGNIGDLIWHLILPVCVLVLVFLASYLKYSRASMLEVLHMDYVRTARAKGAPEKHVIYRHALRNALIPIITVLGLDLPNLVSGAALTENVFNWPGMGRLFVEMAFAREYAVLMAITMLGAVFVVIGNLLADILYAIVDPRVQLGKKGGTAA